MELLHKFDHDVKFNNSTSRRCSWRRCHSLLKSSSPSPKRRKLSEQECKAGNLTVCQTSATMRQAAKERRQSDLLHHDPLVELHIAKECWQTAMPADHVSGYIQQLGSELFHVVFYCQRQVQLYMDSCKAGNATLDVDATGCIVRNIRGQKRTLYYCIVLGDCSIPVFDAAPRTKSADDV